MIINPLLKIFSLVLVSIVLVSAGWAFMTTGSWGVADASSQVTETEGYFAYDAGKLNTSKTTVLFFKTNWCGTCTGLYKDIQNNLDQIPSSVQIMEVDYDKNYNLKSFYDVRVQHTLIQVNDKGEMVKTWHGSPTLEDLLIEIQA
jgi:hypothetical protein